jgi:hypothetical protein
VVEAGSEWRGLNGRDFAFILHSGHSFFKDGALYLQGFLDIPGGATCISSEQHIQISYILELTEATISNQ